VGFDIGSQAVHYAVLDAGATVVYSPKPIKHLANPIKAMGQAWRDILGRFELGSIQNTALTGSGSIFIKDSIPVTYDYDSVAIPSGAAVIAPDAQYVFHLGAKDSYFFHIKSLGNKPVIVECRFSSKCGGGSGTLLDKQCKRLLDAQTDVNDCQDCIYKRAEDLARNAQSPSEFLARCGIVIQSDLIHKQNEGVGKADNLAGLFRTVARNYKIDVLGNRVLEKSYAIGTGGVFNNELIRHELEKVLNITITRPAHFENIGAIGAARKSMDSDIRSIINMDDLEAIAEQGKSRRSFAPSLASHLDKVHEATIAVDGVINAGTEVVIGIDGGSTTTKCAMVSLDGALLDKLYIKTSGDPENSLKEVLRYLGRHKNNVTVCGIGVTGSARTLYEKLLLSRKKIDAMQTAGIIPTDRITDEITCHAMGVKHYDKDVDTIFEIGGQDMKYTIFNKDGSVRDAKMNFSCQAGCGQTLENMADIIGLDVKSSLQDYAMKAARIPIIDSTCGVFMEMDQMRLIAEGFSKEEIAAAIIRGTAASYYHKFVGGAQHTGSKCSAQGGPALGRAFLAALAQVADKDIYAYPHREIFGAWGAALDVIGHIRPMKQKHTAFGSAFRGWELITMEFCKSRRKCKEVIDGSCDMRDCVLDVFDIDGEVILSGGFCPKGNSENRRKTKPNYVEVFHSVFNKHFRKYGCLLEELEKQTDCEKTVGIRRATSTITEKGIWSAALLADLGFTPAITPVSNPAIAQMGVDHSRTDFCIARKLVTGHTMLLMNHPEVRYLFNPSFVEHFQKNTHSLKYCIYTASEAYILNDDLTIEPARQISPILQFGQERILVDNLRRELIAKGFTFPRKRIQQALAFAEQAEAAFVAELGKIGDMFMERTRDTIAYVGIGRDYVLLDPEASSYAGTMFSQVRGLDYIPQIFLKHRFGPLEQAQLDVEYWCESIDILRAHHYVGHMNLYPIRLMNFGCGPDSVKLYHEERIEAQAPKPMLVLLTDAQTNNAPFVTRTEAFERVVNQHYQTRESIHEHKHKIQSYRASNVADTVHGNQQPHRGGMPSTF
jgi:predicted CoA-substrate-specific enzyme activase